MFEIENFYLFIYASLLINLTPGPDMLYTAARSLSQGMKAGILSATGVFVGCFFHITAAVFGLSKIIEESVLLFSIIKYAGAVYLIYLGLKAILSKKKEAAAIGELEKISLKKIFLQGMLTNILNPKVAIFFLSFLPQFVNPQSANVQQQIAFLGTWFAAQGTLVLMLVALITGYFQTLLLKNTTFWTWQEKFTGMILVGLGIKLLFTKK